MTIAGMLLCGQALLAQARLTFEVASVKEHPPAQRLCTMETGEAERFIASNCAVTNMIVFAYETALSSIEGLPSWGESVRYDISAKAERPTSVLEKRAMVRSLLEDRFKLRTHGGASEGPIYALTVAKTGTLGPNMRPASAACVAAEDEQERNGHTALTCGDRFVVPGASFNFGALTMKRLAQALTDIVRRPVLDQTNLQGRYDVSLVADATPFLFGDRASIAPSSQPSISTALQEQAGLKLTPGRGPVQTFVIDSIERPTPD